MKDSATPRILTRDEKKRALLGFLQKNKLISFAPDIDNFAPDIDNAHQNTLTDALIDVLLTDEMLCGKAINERVHFVLHDKPTAPPLELRSEDQDIFVPVAPQQPDARDSLHNAINAAIANREKFAAEHDPSMPLSAATGSVTGYGLILGSGLADENGLNGMTRGKGAKRDSYDPMAETLPDGIKHTHGQLAECGKARTEPLKDPGGHWLWKVKYAYVLSDEALRSKTPGRWFRDICVVSGVSTILLAQLTRTRQTVWSKLQNNTYQGTQTYSKHILSALSVVLSAPLTVGQLNNSDHWTFPAGSLFGLKTIEQQAKDGSIHIIVDPAELNRINTALFGVPLQSKEECARYNLNLLTHLSDAYSQSAIDKQEFKDLNIVRSLLHDAILPFGFNIVFPDKSKKYLALHSFFCGRHTNIELAIETLKAMNAQYLHMGKAAFDRCINAIQELPNGNKPFSPLPPEKALQFAKNHHEGTLRSFIRTYRKARHETAEMVGMRCDSSHQDVSEIEAIDNNLHLMNHVLRQNNPWKLPEDENGVIRADVREYIENFRNHVKAPAPEAHWLTASEALEQFAGIETETHGETACEKLASAISKALSDCPKKERYALITLPGRHDVLVKHDGGEVRLYAGDLGPWLHAFARDTHHITIDDTRESWVTRTAAQRPENGQVLPDH